LKVIDNPSGSENPSKFIRIENMNMPFILFRDKTSIQVIDLFSLESRIIVKDTLLYEPLILSFASRYDTESKTLKITFLEYR